jgi:hypothetical protein
LKNLAVSPAAGLKSSQSNRSRNYKKANIEPHLGVDEYPPAMHRVLGWRN